MRLTGLICAAIAAGVINQQASATLIAYEGFDYPAGPVATGASGGTGWSGNWDAALEAGTGLTQGDLTTTNGAAIGPASGSVDANRTIPNVNSGSLWFSYLLDTRNGTYGKFMLRNTGFNRPIWIGSEPWESTVHTSQNIDTADIGARNQQYFVIGRLDFNVGATTDNDVLRLWLLPSPTGPSETAPADGAATYTDLDVTDVGTINRAEIHVSGASVFDEIRLGTTYADVAPVAAPEPASLAALSVVALLGRRQRKPLCV